MEVKNDPEIIPKMTPNTCQKCAGGGLPKFTFGT